MQKAFTKIITKSGIEFRFRIIPNKLESGSLVYSWTLLNPYDGGSLEVDTSWTKEELETDLEASAIFQEKKIQY